MQENTRCENEWEPVKGSDATDKNENVPAEESEYRFIRKHPDGAGDIKCLQCNMIQIVYGDAKEQLRRHTLHCKYCLARFTGMIKEDIPA